jgi:hypothetical protein
MITDYVIMRIDLIYKLNGNMCWRAGNLPPSALYTGLGMACGSGNGIDNDLLSLVKGINSTS